MERNDKFKTGFLSGLCAMLVIAGIVLFARGEVIKQENAALKAQKEAEAQASDGLYLDQERVERKLANIESIINQYYLDEIDREEVESWMYKGLVAGLGDTYAAYYTKEELEKTEEASSGAYNGIGAVMTQNRTTGMVVIVRCYEGIKTEPGDTVKIEVAREGEEDYLSFDVPRAPIEVPTVEYEMLDGKIGYIEIVEFDTVTEAQFSNALADLEEQGMEKLIIDLRNNPGGVLGTVCNMLEQILPKGLIVYTEDKNGNRTEYKSDGSHEFKKPLAVLVNGNSASASEIFAGAVKDYGIGTLVGTKTFGKGIVQRIISLNDGTGIKLTVAKYFTPKGNDIHQVGIEPDVEVELDEALKQKVTIEKSEDNQLQKAIEILGQTGEEQ